VRPFPDGPNGSAVTHNADGSFIPGNYFAGASLAPAIPSAFHFLHATSQITACGIWIIVAKENLYDDIIRRH
jgi:hypothetical protein